MSLINLIHRRRTPAGALTPPGRGRLVGVDVNDVTTRRCSTCLVVRPEDQFGARRTAKFPEGKPYKICGKCRAYKVGQVQRPRAAKPCEPGTQRCPQCGTTKAIGEFTGVRCTPCRDAWNAEHRSRVVADAEYRARKLRNTRESNRRTGRFKGSIGGFESATCRRCSTPFTYQRAGSRKKTLCTLCHKYRQEGLYYGLTGLEAATLRARLACDICGSRDPGSKHGLFRIDHCHETGIVRGVLCNPCNFALGFMKDKPDRLRAAADYIEKYRVTEPRG